MELSVKELRCSKPRLTRAGVAKLQSYDWPGNIRELRNVIERAVIVSRGGALDFDLPVRHSPPLLATREATSSEPEILTEPELQRRERENLLVPTQNELENQGRRRRCGTSGSETNYLGYTDEEMGTPASRVAPEDVG